MAEPDSWTGSSPFGNNYAAGDNVAPCLRAGVQITRQAANVLEHAKVVSDTAMRGFGRGLLDVFVMKVVLKGLPIPPNLAARIAQAGYFGTVFVESDGRQWTPSEMLENSVRLATATGLSGAMGAKSGSLKGGVNESQPGGQNETPQTETPAPTAQQQVDDLPGHGNDRHGSQTTIDQHATRVTTGIAPDGRRAPTPRSTRFDSPEAQLDAVNRATARTNARDASGQSDHTIFVDRSGTARLPADVSVVTGHPGGYGSGVSRGPAPPGGIGPRNVLPTGQDMNAKVILERNPITGRWDPVTQYPTDQSVTP